MEDRIAGEPEGEIQRLLTTLLDPEEASAAELAELYSERWEVKSGIKEVQTGAVLSFP